MLQNAKLSKRRFLLCFSASEDRVQTNKNLPKPHHTGNVKAPDTIKISGRFYQKLKTNKILNILLVRYHVQRVNITTHEYRKHVLMTFLLITYKNTLKQKRVFEVKHSNLKTPDLTITCLLLLHAACNYVITYCSHRGNSMYGIDGASGNESAMKQDFSHTCLWTLHLTKS